MWPFSRRRTPERRAAAQGGYAAQILAGAEARAAGTGQAPAILAACVRWYETLGWACRADHPLVGPDLLSFALGACARYGESFWVLDPGGPPIAATLATIRGSANPESWTYTLTAAGPSASAHYQDLPAGAVLHFRIGARPWQPWRGCAPLAEAGLAPAAAAELEAAIRDEGKVPVARGIQFGEGMSPNQTASAEAEVGQRWFGGNLVLADRERDFQGERASPINQIKVGPDISDSNVAALREFKRSTAAAFGLPDEIVNAGQNPAGPAQREAFRRWANGPGQALVRMLEVELSRKLGPVAIDSTRLGAADLQVRTRGFRALVGSSANMDPAAAARLVGLEGSAT